MVKLTIELPEEVFSALRETPEHLEPLLAHEYTLKRL